MIVRPYRAGDRPAVRRICYRTGFMGEEPDWFWRDRESFADLFTSYYTDEEPSSAFVAVAGPGEEAPAGAVVGYLLGCLDSRCVPPLSTLLRSHLLRRGLLARPGTAGVLWRGIGEIAGDLVSGRGLPEQDFQDERFPSHLHIDLLREARGHGAGHRLMGAWLERLGEAGSPGCHLQTIAENRPAIAFFEHEGFELHGDHRPLPGWRARDGSRLHLQVMVRSLP